MVIPTSDSVSLAFKCQSLAAVLVLSYIQSHNKELLTDITIYSQENTNKCLLDPQPWRRGSDKLRSVNPSLCPFLHLSIRPSLCLPVSFEVLGIYILIFSDVWYGTKGPCGLCVTAPDILGKSPLSKNNQKW